MNVVSSFFYIGVNVQFHGLAKTFDVEFANFKIVLVVGFVNLATLNSDIVKDIGLMFGTVANEVDGLYGFDVFHFVPQEVVELFACQLSLKTDPAFASKIDPRCYLNRTVVNLC